MNDEKLTIKIYTVLDRLIDLLESVEHDMNETTNVSINTILSANTARQHMANLENLCSIELKEFLRQHLRTNVTKRPKLN